MSISIILPVYNVEQYIESCLTSLSSQTYKEFDIIAVDDCSTDSSMQVFNDTIKKLHFADGQVRVIHHQYNRGLSAARNTGIKESSADYVFFLDSDDIITPDCLMLLASSIKENEDRIGKIDMAVGNYAFDGPNIGCPKLHVGKELLNRREYIKEYCKEHIFPMAWNRLVRRDFILENNLFFEEGLIHEDTLWNFMVLQFVSNVTAVEKEVYIYKVRQNSIQSSDNFLRHFEANSYIIGKLCDIQFSSRLKYNRYVYNFIEQEKLRHLYDCYHSGNEALIPQLYAIYRNKPHFLPWQAKLICFPDMAIIKKINKRDSHYNLSFDNGLEAFRKMAFT